MTKFPSEQFCTPGRVMSDRKLKSHPFRIEILLIVIFEKDDTLIICIEGHLKYTIIRIPILHMKLCIRNEIYEGTLVYSSR